MRLFQKSTFCILLLAQLALSQNLPINLILEFPNRTDCYNLDQDPNPSKRSEDIAERASCAREPENGIDFVASAHIDGKCFQEKRDGTHFHYRYEVYNLNGQPAGVRETAFSASDSNCCGDFVYFIDYPYGTCVSTSTDSSLGFPFFDQTQFEPNLLVTLFYKDSACTDVSFVELYSTKSCSCYNSDCRFDSTTGLYKKDLPCPEGEIVLPTLTSSPSCPRVSSSSSSSSSSSYSGAMSTVTSDEDVDTPQDSQTSPTPHTSSGTRAILRVNQIVTAENALNWMEALLGVTGRIEINGLTFVGGTTTEIDFTITDPPGSSPSSSQLLQKLKGIIDSGSTGGFQGPISVGEWTEQSSGSSNDANSEGKSVGTQVKSNGSSLVSFLGLLLSALLMITI